MRFGFSWVVPGRGETVVRNRAAIKELRNLIRPPFRPSMRGGRPAAVYMEGSGVYVSSYNLLVLGKRLGTPMLLIVAYYGSVLDKRNSFLYALPGIHLIPILQSLDIQYEVLDKADGLEDKVKGAVKMMHAIKQPVALLFTGEFTA